MVGLERPGKHLHGGDAMRIDSGINTGFTGGLQNGISAALALQSSSRLERAAIVSRPVGSFAGTRPTVSSTSTIGGSTSALGDLGRQLAELRTLIERGDGKGPGLGLDLGEIERLARAVDRALGGASPSTSPYVIDDVDFVVANPEVTRATIPNGEAVDVNVNVTSPGERAGLFIEIGSERIEGQTSSSFTLELSGALGTQEFSFPSGASLATIVSDINRFSEVTGVQAERVAFGSEIGVKVTSFDVGADAFARVRIIDDGGIRFGRGVSVISGEDDGTPLGPYNSFAVMEASGSEVGDRGRDIEATINGYQATVSGHTISIDEPELALSMDLRRIGLAPGSPFGANFAGFGRAFTIRAADDARLAGGGQSLVDGVSSGDREGSVAAIDRLLDALGYDARRPGLAFDGRG